MSNTNLNKDKKSSLANNYRLGENEKYLVFI